MVSYPLDHILALGAIGVWYARELEKKILSQFEVLVIQGLVGVVKIEEIVVRAFLLLVMDQAAYADASTESGSRRGAGPSDTSLKLLREDG